MRTVATTAAIAAFIVGIASCSSGGPSGSSDGSAGSGGSGGAGGSFAGTWSDQFRQRNVDDINKYRATKGIAPVKLDMTLCTFAQAGTVEESKNHVPHDHFMTALASGAIWKDGFASAAGENQGDPNGWLAVSTDPTKNELEQVDAIQKVMFDEGPGSGDAHGHYENIMNPMYDRVGVGLLEIDDKLYLTNDFSAD